MNERLSIEMSDDVTIGSVQDVNALWHMSKMVLSERVSYLEDVISRDEKSANRTKSMRKSTKGQT